MLRFYTLSPGIQLTMACSASVLLTLNMIGEKAQNNTSSLSIVWHQLTDKNSHG